MRVVLCRLQRFNWQTEVLVNVGMYQLPDYDEGREQPVAPRHRAPKLSDMRPVLLEILMSITTMPRFLNEVNLRQFAHHRMAFRILLGAAIQVSDDVFSGQRAEHHRNSGGQVLAEKRNQAREARLVPRNLAALDRFAEHHGMTALVGHFDLHPIEMRVEGADVDQVIHELKGELVLKPNQA